jgi:hypothetical protein
MTRTLAAVTLLALAPVLLGPPSALAQTANCGWYADTSLKQQQRNEQGKCGFKGPEWNSNRQTHLTWCATQSPDSWKAQAQKREQMLAGCKR